MADPPAANPYVGPRPFEPGETLYGREHEIEELYYLLAAERIVLLCAPSGAGKSSLVQAGLLPRLRSRFDVWRPTRVSLEPPPELQGEGPDGHRVNRYAFSALQGWEEGMPEAKRRPPSILAEASLARYVAERPRRPGAPPSVVLVFDQFEEILTVDPLATDAKHAFFVELGELLREPTIWALFILREDYLAPLDPYAHQVPTHLRNRYRIDLLGLEAAERAIAEPARTAGRDFSAAAGLARDLATVRVQQADGSFAETVGGHVEPVQLQVVCRRLWDALPNEQSRIDKTDLERFGDVTEALSSYYADAVGRLADGDRQRQRELRDFFGGPLIADSGIRGQVPRGPERTGGLPNAVVERLLDTYLVRSEKRAGAIWYELAHDRLLEPVRSDNARWRAENLTDLERRAELWQREGRPSGLLMGSETFLAAGSWAEDPDKLTSIERDFLAAARRAAGDAERERQQARRVRQLAIAACLSTAVALIAGLFALFEWRHAATLHAQAQAQNLEARKALARVHGKDARRLIDTGSPRRALAHLGSALRLAPELAALRGRTVDLLQRTDVLLPPALEHLAPLTAAAISPSGRRLMTASLDGTARLWDAASGKPLADPMDHFNAVLAASFSPDGQHLLTACADGAARLWSAEDGSLLDTFPVLGDPPGELLDGLDATVRYSPDGEAFLFAAKTSARLWTSTGEPLGPALSHSGPVIDALLANGGQLAVTLTGNGILHFWDPRSGAPADPQRLRIPGTIALALHPRAPSLAAGSADGTVHLVDLPAATVSQDTPRPSTRPLAYLATRGLLTTVAITPDGRRLAVGTASGEIQLFSLINGRPLGDPMRHDRAITALTFDLSARRLISAADDNRAQVWDITEDPVAASLQMPHDGPVRAAVFSSDGTHLATASDDGRARVFETATGSLSAELDPGAGSPVLDVSWSRDGTLLASAAADGAVRLWQVGRAGSGTLLLRHDGAARDVAWNSEGSLLASASDDGTARIWDIAAGRPALPPIVQDAAIVDVSWSPSGEIVATVAADGLANLWSSDTGKPASTPLRHASAVRDATFTPDGERFVTGTDDGTARLWDVATSTPIGEPMHHHAAVLAVAASPDGKLLATASADATARLWDARTAQPVGEEMSSAAAVFALAFSPGSERLATASSDGAVRVWEATNGTPMTEPFLHPATVTSVRFGPGGHRLATADEDGTAHLWDVLTGSDSEAELLAELAEVISGYSADSLETLRAIPPMERSHRLNALRQIGLAAPGSEPTIPSFVRWVLQPARQRPTTPLTRQVDQEIGNLTFPTSTPASPEVSP